MQPTNPSRPVAHKPVNWTVVAQSERHVVIFAMCACGDDDCSFVHTVYPDQFTHNCAYPAKCPVCTNPTT